MPRRVRNPVRSVTSDFIATKLHLHLSLQGWRVWHEVTLGPTFRDYGRADIWALRVSWSPMQSRIYEIKVSRADFLKDRDSGKWQKYIPHATEVFFAVPTGLVEPDEVPSPAGLVYVEKGKKPKIVKKAEVSAWKPDPYALIALLMSISTPPDPPRVFTSLHGPRQEDVHFLQEMERERIRTRLKLKHKNRSKGKDAARAVAKAEEEVRECRNRCQKMESRVAAIEEVAKALGVLSFLDVDLWKEDILERIEALKKARLSVEAKEAIRVLIREVGV